MPVPFNFSNPTTYTNPVLIGNYVDGVGFAPDSLPTLTQAGGLPASAALELQSTTGALIISRMTTAQRTAGTFNPVNGMMVYDTTLNNFQLYQGGAWTAIEAMGGTIVAGLGTAAAPSYTFTGRLGNGMYSESATTTSFASGGVRAVGIDTGGVLTVYNTGTGVRSAQFGATGNLVLYNPATVNTLTHLSLVTTNVTKATISVTLNQAAIQGMFALAQPLIAAPGAGNTIFINKCMAANNFNTAAYANGGVVVVQYGNGAGGAGTSALSAASIPAAFITSATSASTALNGQSGVTNNGASIVNQGIFISNQGMAFTGGNAATTVVVTIEYFIIAAGG